MDKLYALVDRLCTSETVAAAVVSTAQIVGHLYAWQLQEIDDGR
jgi:hypothetical protein